MKTNKLIRWILTTVVLLAVIFIILSFSTSLSAPESFRIVFGSVYILFLPGFIISFIFFPKTKPFEAKENREESEKGSIDWIERIALSFALSIAVVPLTVFYLNLIGVKINLLNSFFSVLGIIIVSSVILRIKLKKQKK